MPDRTEFINFLRLQASSYLGQLEMKLGVRDKRFVFGTIKKSTKCGPHTGYPGLHHLNGHCIVDIHVSKRAWDEFDCGHGAWDVAHECVHLLDPTEDGDATFLEEGLGAWFQDQPGFHVDSVKKFVIDAARDRPPGDNYTIAKKLVCELMPQIVPVVKELRSPTVWISNIDADMLAWGLERAGRTNVRREILGRLCSIFHS